MEKIHEDGRITVYVVKSEAEAKAKVEVDTATLCAPVEVRPWTDSYGRKFITYVW